MKSILLISSLLFACLASSRPSNLKVSPVDVTNWAAAFLQGFQFSSIVPSNINCTNDIGSIVNYTTSAINQYYSANWYAGTLNLTSGLAWTSNMTRDCSLQLNQTSIAFGTYVAQFANFTDFVSKLTLNMMGNVFTIRSLST